jgi:hypothetical protein
MRDDGSKDSPDKLAGARRRSAMWLRWLGAIAFVVFVTAGGVEWRVVWCAHHKYCKPAGIQSGHIKIVDDPKQDQPEAVGFVAERGEERNEYVTSTGPSSFAVSKGILAIADTVKQRVALFDADTLKYEKSIDEFHFPPQRVNLSGDILLVRARFGLSDNDAICSLSSGHCMSLSNASLDEVKKLRAEEQSLASIPGIPSGLAVSIPNLISVNPIGSDGDRNTYLVSRQRADAKNGIVSTCLKYSPGNVLLATSPPIPAYEDGVDVVDPIRVDENGTCYAMLVKQNDVQIWRWVTR